MSTKYYISNRKKREEIQAFNDFWEKNLIPGLKKQIGDYCKEASGEYVNPAFAEAVIDDKVSGFSYPPGDASSYEAEICSTRYNGSRTLCQWEGICVDDDIIRDESSLIDFFQVKENQKRYCITDEYDKEYTLAEFLDMIRSVGK